MNKQELELKEQYLPNNYRETNSSMIKGKEIVFSLLEPIAPKNNTSFYFTYKSNETFSLIFNEQKFLLPAVSVQVSIRISLDQSYILNSFKIIPSSEDCTVEFLDMGIIGDDEIKELNGKIILTYNSENNLTLINNFIIGIDSFSMVLNSDEISDDFDTLIHIDDEREYLIKTRGGLNQFWFYDLGLDPYESIILDLGHNSLSALDFNPSIEPEEAISIDLEEFISQELHSWRQENYELFRWDLFPQILLLDTLSYDVQAAFFKRLAFYTEKKHTVGDLLSDEELHTLHGWNAHDYKADDISRFFNEALKTDFILNEYELLLKELLLANGVLINSGNRVRPGMGGILSISRSSTERLRWLFMTHECYHGVFFSSDKFILAVTDIWVNLAEEEREFWKIFLDMSGYNIRDEYLLINEFQAYLMQQNITLADSYFRGKIQWILSFKPQLQSSFDYLLSEYSDTFSKSAKAVENAAYSLTGIRAGDLVLKRKK